MRLPILVSAVVIGTATVVVAQTQEIRPTWKNLETWSRYDAKANQTEIGLGLHPNGTTGGSLSVAFTATFPGKSPKPPAPEILVRVVLGPNYDSSVIRDTKFAFVLDEGLPKLTVLNISGSFLGNELIPTTNLRSGIARMTPAEYQRVTRARSVKLIALSSEANFSKVQL